MTNLLTAIIIGVGTCANVEVTEHFDSYYVSFVTGVPSAQPFSVQVLKGDHTVANFFINKKALSMFGSVEAVEIKIMKVRGHSE